MLLADLMKGFGVSLICGLTWSASQFNSINDFLSVIKMQEKMFSALNCWKLCKIFRKKKIWDRFQKILSIDKWSGQINQLSELFVLMLLSLRQ